MVIGILFDDESETRSLEEDNGDDNYVNVNNKYENVEPILQVFESVAKNIVKSCEGSTNQSRGDNANVLNHEKMEGLNVADNWSPYDLLPMEGNNGLAGAYFYVGSLTTPPCSTGISWYIFDTLIQLSSDQLGRLENLMASKSSPSWPSCEYVSHSSDWMGNYRPTQNMGNRDIAYICSL